MYGIIIKVKERKPVAVTNQRHLNAKTSIANITAEVETTSG
jgi:hypothetical protein